MKIAKGSKSWILNSLILAIFFTIIFIVSYKEVIGSVFLLLSAFFYLLIAFFLVFFRDPDRRIGQGIVVPADGKIREISEIDDEDIGKCVCISIFMNLHNVHVNRMPLDGTVKSITHIFGMHLPAFKKESVKNERVIILIDSKIGLIKIVQIAGSFARRIVSYIKAGDKLKKGDRIGIIRLGSRVDLYLPLKIDKIKVKLKNKVIAGEDIIAKIND